jgi:hypothetical protein
MNEPKRTSEPDFLIQYRELIKKGEPRCCHTCEHYNDIGHCERYDMRPPDEFTQTQDACPAWLYDIPF